MTSTSKSKIITVIKADPGWYVAHFVHPGTEYQAGIHLEPIIAWEIVRTEEMYLGSPIVSTEVLPLTLEGNQSVADKAVKQPDGRFCLPYDQVVDNEAELIEIFEKQRAKA